MGIHSLSSNVEAIKKMPSPINIKELKAFLGAISYYGRFIPMLHSRCGPFYDLTKKIRLVHYDPSKEIFIATDASNAGIGATMFQIAESKDEKPIICISRTLNDAEKQYSVTKKEALAMIFAVKNFNTFTDDILR
ncbi:Retrovirus-related Pol polyprotein from transposon 17.6 [Thelohanellus kitauei]|uniref:Retrovirus-related Pol polyprotein from transposon 17.6 n=1 Tax=Thelohanellus kitauei TaxID=669202 RepID=A0A0C2N6X5_THEKT|nr:Retrovirus-related Pol polyprotein from transposon 17.6 [Thelohanellus kitauei]